MVNTTSSIFYYS